MYTIFDSETVTKIMRVEKKLGGTYLFIEEKPTNEEKTEKDK